MKNYPTIHFIIIFHVPPTTARLIFHEGSDVRGSRWLTYGFRFHERAWFDDSTPSLIQLCKGMSWNIHKASRREAKERLTERKHRRCIFNNVNLHTWRWWESGAWIYGILMIATSRGFLWILALWLFRNYRASWIATLLKNSIMSVSWLMAHALYEKLFDSSSVINRISSLKVSTVSHH